MLDVEGLNLPGDVMSRHE